MLKKFPSDKINFTKNTVFSLSRVQTHHSFTFNSRFLYKLKRKVHLSESMRGVRFSVFNSFNAMILRSYTKSSQFFSFSKENRVNFTLSKMNYYYEKIIKAYYQQITCPVGKLIYLKPLNLSAILV